LSSVSVLQPIRELDEDSAELLLDLALEDDSAELLLDLALEEDPSSQSSHTLDDPSEGRVAKSLSSSLHATKKNATNKMDPIAALRLLQGDSLSIFPPISHYLKYKKKPFKGKPK
jgi:hypothetical protein